MSDHDQPIVWILSVSLDGSCVGENCPRKWESRYPLFGCHFAIPIAQVFRDEQRPRESTVILVVDNRFAEHIDRLLIVFILGTLRDVRPESVASPAKVNAMDA